MRNYLFFYLFALCFLSTAPVNAQSAAQMFNDAEFYYNAEEYNKALPFYLSLDSLDQENSNFKYKIGVCYINSTLDKTKAIPYLEKAIQNITGNYVEGSRKERYAPYNAYKYLGKAYHLNNELDKAIEHFQKYLTFVPPTDNAEVEDVNRQIEQCQNAKIMEAAPINITITNLGSAINTEYADYAPVVTADELNIYFTSRRQNTTGGKVSEDDGIYYEDIYLSSKKDTSWLPAVNLGEPVNSNEHEATVGISVDGQQLLIYKSKNEDIYVSKLQGSVWSEPEPFKGYINSKYWEPHASISADGTELYFTSDRPGGIGGRDIYKCKLLPTGEWGRPQNLGPTVNTIYDEDAPYIHPDGVTLFFSSRGHKTIGGFDIFFSVKSEAGWTPPQNMGYPLNTTDDDVFYFPSASNTRAYYSSIKPGGYGDKDIYLITFPDQKESQVTVFKGTVKGIFGDKVPAGVIINVTDNATGELVGTYRPNSETGKYLFILTPGRDYNISYEAAGYLFHSENMNVPIDTTYSTVEQEVEMKPIQVGQKIILKNIFFESGKADLKAESKIELDKLLKLMLALPEMSVEISGHTDAAGDENSNMVLSQKRAQAVVDFLTSHGVKLNRLTAKGYGETQPIAENYLPNKNPNKEGMAVNRRIEFKITGVTGNNQIEIEKIKIPPSHKK